MPVVLSIGWFLDEDPYWITVILPRRAKTSTAVFQLRPSFSSPTNSFFRFVFLDRFVYSNSSGEAWLSSLVFTVPCKYLPGGWMQCAEARLKKFLFLFTNFYYSWIVKVSSHKWTKKYCYFFNEIWQGPDKIFN